MKPVVCIVGKSYVGKTTFLEKLVQELKRRGYRVAVIKHNVHNFEIDYPGKDTWCLAQAGSDAVMISSPSWWRRSYPSTSWRLSWKAGWTLNKMALIVLAESYKRSNKPKIEISRAELGSELLCREEELIAIVSDQRFPFAVPHFDLEDSAGVADLLAPLIGQSR